MRSLAILPGLAPPLAVAIVAGAVLSGWLCSLGARLAARRFGIVSTPNPIVPQHRRPVAYLGGLGVALGATAALAAALAWTASPLVEVHILRLVAVPGLAFLAIGLVDDLVALSAAVKLLAQGAAAALAVTLASQSPLAPLGVADCALSFAWIILVVNAVNVTDVCDGLVAGIGVVGLGTMAIAHPEAWALAAVLGGSTLGFLVINRPPASIFLGDAGSHLLGYALAALGLLHLHQHRTAAAASLGVVIVAVPLFEVGLLAVARRSRGLNVLEGSPDHFALRLQAHGYTRWQVDGLAWAAAGIACALGLGLSRISPVLAVIGLGALMIGGLGAGRALLGIGR